jgi:hypothetical protein
MTSSSELKAKRGDGWPASESRISWSILPGVHYLKVRGSGLKSVVPTSMTDLDDGFLSALDFRRCQYSSPRPSSS